MTEVGRLWAVGYDDVRRAELTRDEVHRLAERHCLTLLDTAIVVRYADGAVTLDGEPFVVATRVRGRALARILAGLALGAPPLTSAGVGVLFSGADAAGPAATCISDDFVREVEELMKPGTSALFVLEQVGDLPGILEGIRGLGGTVLKTTVDLARTKLIQSTLAAAATDDDSQHSPQSTTSGK
jgi:uncharacterized membrane protein